MKKIWMRVGMEADLTDEQYEELLKAEGIVGGTVDLSGRDSIIKNMIKNATLSGETYIVGKNLGGVADYDNPDEEISTFF